MVLASLTDLLKIVRVLKRKKKIFSQTNKQTDSQMKNTQESCNENAGQQKQRSVYAPTVITSCFIFCAKQHLKHLLLLGIVNIILLN